MTTVRAYRKQQLVEKPRRARFVREAPHVAGDLVVLLELPLRTRTEGNNNEFWRARQKRARHARGITKVSLRARRRADDLKLPLNVLLTRIAPRLLDEVDNVSSSLKHVRDGVADWLGIDDKASSPINWHYHQEQQTKTYAVRIEIFEAER